MRTLRPVLVAGLWLAGVYGQPAWATDYFVAQSPAAADTNSGDAAHPWRTIAAAVARLSPGDSITVRAGDYRREDSGWGPGVIPFLVSGKEGQPIRFVAADGERVLVNRFLLQKCHDLQIVGCRFLHPRTATDHPWRDMPEIVRDQPSAGRALDSRQTGEQRNQLIAEQAFQSYFRRIKQLEYDSALELQDCRRIDLQHNSIDGYWAGIQCRHCEGITIEANEIQHCVNGIYTWQPSPALTNSLIRGNKITQSLDNGIDLREQTHHVRIEANRVRYSGHSHISLQNGTRHCIVRNNDVRFGGYYSESMKYPGSSAISIHSSRDGIVVAGNLVAHQIDLTGIDGNGIIIDRMQAGASVTVCDNRVWRNAGAGLNTTLSPNALIYNNAFVENGFQAQERRRGAGVKLSRDEDIRQTIVNNILANNRAAGILGYHSLNQQLRIDSNLYFSADSRPLIWDGNDDNERSYRTLDAIRAYTPWEQNGIVGDPRFQDVSRGDFRLQPGSPAIGAAGPVPTAGQSSGEVPPQIGPRFGS